MDHQKEKEKKNSMKSVWMCATMSQARDHIRQNFFSMYSVNINYAGYSIYYIAIYNIP